MKLIKSDIFEFEDIDLLFEMLHRVEHRLDYFESRHEGYSHSHNIVFAKGSYQLIVDIYEEHKYRNNSQIYS